MTECLQFKSSSKPPPTKYEDERLFSQDKALQFLHHTLSGVWVLLMRWGVLRFERLFLDRTLHFRGTPSFRPLDRILENPVVRTARQAPISNGWIKRDALAIKSHAPAIWRQVEDDWVPATTAAFVSS